MSYLNIHKALTQSVIDMDLGLPIAYENVDFDTDVAGLNQYIRVNIMFDQQNTVTKTGLDDVKGFLQITNYSKSGTSTAAIYSFIDSVKAFYPHAKKITSGTQVVNIQNIAVNKRGNSNGWYATDITINFWSDFS